MFKKIGKKSEVKREEIREKPYAMYV